MGVRFPEEKARNQTIYGVWKTVGKLDKKQRHVFMKLFDISERRIYAIIAQVKRKVGNGSA